MPPREDRLDMLLAAPFPLAPPPPGRAATAGDRRDPATPGTPTTPGTPLPGDAELAPLLAAARDLAPFAQARPDPLFVARLGERMLARAAVLRANPALAQPALGIAAFAARADRADDPDLADGADGADAPTPAAMERAAAGRAATGYAATGRAGVVPGTGIRTLPRQGAGRRGSLRPALVAATLLVLLGGGALVAALAASAAPGTPLFGLRQFEQHAGQNFMDASGRAQNHLRAAHQWLGDLRAAASGQPGTGSYRATLDALLGEDAAAAQAIQQVAPGTTRDTLTADLAALRADEHATLLAVLSQLDWPDRIATSQALGSLGAAVPAIAGAAVTPGQGLWQVTLTGTGFAPGAVLLIDGRPLGIVLSVSSTTLIAQAPSGLLKNGGMTLGIGNPDGTAAATTTIEQVAAPIATPPPDNHGSGNNGNKDGPRHPNPRGTPPLGA